MSGEDTVNQIASQYAEKYSGTDEAAIELSYRMSAAANAMRRASDLLFASFGPIRAATASVSSACSTSRIRRR